MRRAMDLGLLPVLVVLVAATAGCVGAQRPLYEWYGYEASLQAKQIAHDDVQASAELEATVQKVEAFGHRAPPGVLAEYGLLLLKRGDEEGAVEYFRREASTFPESKPLMERLIARVHESTRAAIEPGDAR